VSNEKRQKMIPLHPLIVHLPLAFAIFTPLACLIAGLRSGPGRWSFFVLWMIVFAAVTYFTLRTGALEFDRIHDRIPESALVAHAEAGETVFYAVASVLLLSLFARGATRIQRALRIAALCLSFGVLSLSIRAGHLGAKLVYEHGAASVQTR